MIGVIKKIKLDNVIVTETSSLDRVVREVLPEYLSLSKYKGNIRLSMPRQDSLLGLSSTARDQMRI